MLPLLDTRHEMPPREQMRIGRQRIDRLQKPSHHERADLEINGIGIRGRPGEVPEAAVAIAAGERPTRGALDGGAAIVTASSFVH